MLNLYDSTVQVQLERQENLVNIFVTINESNTGNYSVGDLHFDISSGCTSWLEQDPDNRDKLVRFLKQVAEKIEGE